MRNHIIFFSGGLSSFSVAHYVKEKYGETDNIVLYFNDTLWEDEDLYRFIYECSDKLKLPMLIQSRGITPPQLMVLQKFMANSRAGTCSQKLKMEVAADYLFNGIKPKIHKWYNKHHLQDEDFIPSAKLYFGIGWTEAHREGAIRHNWEKGSFKVEMPLLDHDIDHHQLLSMYDIKRPRLYDMEFVHNNCKGRCVKGGQAHFLNLLKKDEKTFYNLMEQEIVISEYIRYTRQHGIRIGKCKNHLYNEVWEFVTTGKKTPKIQHLIDVHKYRKKFSVGYDRNGIPINEPYTFMKKKSLQELEQQPLQLDLFDFGGCGCFSDAYLDTDNIDPVCTIRKRENTNTPAVTKTEEKVEQLTLF